jgi:hypothetical protein
MKSFFCSLFLVVLAFEFVFISNVNASTGEPQLNAVVLTAVDTGRTLLLSEEYNFRSHREIPVPVLNWFASGIPVVIENGLKSFDDWVPLRARLVSGHAECVLVENLGVIGDKPVPFLKVIEIVSADQCSR